MVNTYPGLKNARGMVRLACVLAVVVGCPGPTGAQPAPVALRAFDPDSLLAGLDERLAVAAHSPRATARSLRMTAMRFVREQIEARRTRRRLEAALPMASGLGPEADRWRSAETGRFERYLRRVAIRRAETRTQNLRLAAPPPPKRDPQGLTWPRPRAAALTSATGVISGNVSGPSGPVSAQLDLYDFSGEYWSGASSDASGNYSFTGLPTGTYYVKTETYDGLVDEAWDNVPCPYSMDAKACGGRPITVTDGATTTGISFILAAGGRITGVVRAAGTSYPIAGVYVNVYDSSGTIVAHSYTDSLGSYVSYQGLPSGTYFARTWAAGNQGYIDEAFDNIPCAPTCTITAATPITVTSPSTTSNIHFTLSSGGRISGTVTAEASGLPISGVFVSLYSTTHDGYEYSGGAFTLADGTYTVRGLVSGRYYAMTTNWADYLDELYDAIPCELSCSIANGDVIPVVEGATTRGIDFALALGGSISGKVTRSDNGEAIADVPVEIYDDSGSYAGYADTDAAGGYSVGGLPTGQYFALTSAAYSAGLNYMDEVYDDVLCPGYYLCDTTELGTSIGVTQGATTSGVDFALSVGGGLSGTLTNAATGALISGWVSVYDRAGGWITETWAQGPYGVVGLPTGTYYVIAEGVSGEIAELYDDIPCAGCNPLRGDPIVVAVGSITAGVDLALSPGARVSGTVTRADTGAPLDGADVAIWDEAGAYVGYGYTDASGRYTTLSGLLSGTYFAHAYPYEYGTNAWLTGQLYRGIDCLSISVDCSVMSGDPLVLNAPHTLAGVDFALSRGGSISGRVTDAATGLGIPVLGVYARVVAGSGRSASRWASTESSGIYTLSGLPPGRYYVATSNELGYIDEVYDNLPCLSCDVRAGQQLQVRAGSTTSGVNFALAKGGAIRGTVTSAPSGEKLSAHVIAYDSGGTAVRRSYRPAGSGVYEILGLPTGIYHVMADAGTGYAAELYDDIACPGSSCTPASGTPVTVTAGSTTPGVDFALSPSGGISGLVTDAGGVGAVGGRVSAYRSGGELAGTGSILVNGFYKVPGLSAESYYVVAYGGAGLVPEVYDGVPCIGCNPVVSGTAVPVSTGATTRGIDFSLGKAGRIRGVVTTAFGTPIEGATVDIFDSGGGSVATTHTDGQGVYLSGDIGLPGGTYYATARKTGFDPQLYSSLRCRPSCDPTMGTPITVSGSTTVTGIDFRLVGESLDFYTLEPCRLADTRNPAGLLGGPVLSFMSDRNFPVVGVCGVPPDAKSLSINLTVAQPSTQGNLRLHPGRSRIPPSSSLNYTAGLTRANNAIVSLSAIGELAVYCAQSVGTAHAIIDVNGYFK